MRNPGARPALGQRERVEFNEAGHVTKLNLCGLPVSDLVALTALEYFPLPSQYDASCRHLGLSTVSKTYSTVA